MERFIETSDKKSLHACFMFYIIFNASATYRMK